MLVRDLKKLKLEFVYVVGMPLNWETRKRYDNYIVAAQYFSDQDGSAEQFLERLRRFLTKRMGSPIHEFKTEIKDGKLRYWVDLTKL